jgi:L-asparagine oxygenase
VTEPDHVAVLTIDLPEGSQVTSSIRQATHRLDQTTRDLLGKEVAERVAAAQLHPDEQAPILARIGAYALVRHLPGQVLRRLQAFTSTGLHAFLLSNLPTGDLPPTPVNGFGRETELATVNAIHLGLLHLLGVTPFAVDYENDGRLLRNVVPNPAASGLASSWGADSEFFWHTDNPHLPFGEPGTDPRPSVPGFLTFYGLRNREHVPTEIAAVEDAARLVDPDARRVLCSHSFDIGAPSSNDRQEDGSVRTLTGMPVLGLTSDGPRVRYDRGTTRGRTPEASHALDLWSAVLDRMPRHQHVLQPGEFLVFDNYRVLHRRRAFTPGPAATARWLRRCYAS